jgi:ornithine cyclodeaminase/alanine dehydrogenase-like protein (mu-crystallin family)
MDVRWLSKQDVEAVALQPAECIDLVRRTLLHHARGELEMPPKLGVHPPQGRHMHAMPAFIPPMGALGVKWLGDFPSNKDKGLPTLSAVIILSDPATGAALSIMDGTSITAMRTAAMTGVCLQELAVPEVETAAIIGAGVQAQAHIAALPVALPRLTKIAVAGRDEAASRRFGKQNERRYSITLVPCASREQAVRQASVVVTVTNAVTTRLLEPEWLLPGVTLVVLDNGGKETGILSFVDRVFVDTRGPFAGEEVRHRFPTGVPLINGEIGDILAGKIAGRKKPTERILVLNLGIGASDLALACEIYRRASAVGIGSLVSL